MDIILYNILLGFCSVFIGYFLGSFPSGIIISKALCGKDPRLEGSKNSGGTNVGRLYGKKAGFLTILLDMIKTVIPTVAVWAIIKFSGLKDCFEIYNGGNLYILLVPLAASVGHCFPIFANFRGGKTVATYGGFGLMSSWFVSLFGFGTFFITLKAKKYVSLASMLSTVGASISAWGLAIAKIFVGDQVDFFMIGGGSFIKAGWDFAIVTTLIGALLILRHMPNIKRLKNNEERKIKWLK